MTFMVLVQETETEFLSVHYFDCSKYNSIPVSSNSFDAIRTVRPLGVVTARRKVISSSWSLSTVGSSSLSDPVSYSDSCSSSCSHSSW